MVTETTTVFEVGDEIMRVQDPLDDQDLEDLRTRGHCRTRVCSEEHATKMVDIIWHRLEKHGVSKEDRSTWVNVQAPKLSHTVRKQRIFQEAASEEFLGAMDQLLGKGEWERPKDWGMVLYTFPEINDKPWDVVSSSWHWHMNPLRNIDRLCDLFSFNFLSSVEPGGGGTLIVEGIHHVVRKYLSELTPEQREERPAKQIREGFYRFHPWIKELTNRKDEGSRLGFMETADVHGFPCRVVELTGGPGEAVIMDAGIPHARSRNCLEVPRFMRALGIRRRGYAKGRYVAGR